MKRLVDALIAGIQGVTALAAFAGAAPGRALGPFWGVAPERTPTPYIVVSAIGGRQNTTTFGGSGSSYVEPTQIQFAVWDVSLETASANAELLCKTLDPMALSLSNGERAGRLFRLESPRPMPGPIVNGGQKAYAVIVQYKINVNRKVGV